MNQNNINPVECVVDLKKDQDEKAVDKKLLTGCLEAVYAILFGLSLGHIISAFFVWQYTIFNTSFYNNNSKTVAYFFSVLLTISFIQFARIYHYVHEFDKHHGDDSHFVHYLKGFYRIIDRLLRAIATLFVIFCVKDWAAKSLTSLSVNFDSQNPNYASIKPMVNALFIIFGTLILWDIFFVLWKKFSNSYISMKSSNNKNAKLSLAQYDHPLKIGQRLTGVAFALFFYKMIENPNSTIYHILETVFLLLFLICWFADYFPDKLSSWNTIKTKNPRPKKGRLFFSEMFSWLSTIKNLLLGI